MKLKTFTAKDFQISLPETYVGGEPLRNMGEIRQAVKQLPAEKRSFLQDYFRQAIFTFMAADTRQSEGQKKPATCTINVMKTPKRFAALTPQELLQTMTDSLDGATDVLTSDTVEISGNEMVRIITLRRQTRSLFGFSMGVFSNRARNQEPAQKTLTYIFIHEGKFISVIFTAEPEIFDGHKAIFEECIATLKVF